MTDLFDKPATLASDSKVPRDHWDRPLVVPPGGTKPVAYTRCTTFVDCLEDKFKLGRWEQRQTALGLADRPDLLLSVSAHRGDKNALDDIVDKAKEAAKSSAKSTTGTALHKLCEQRDRGEQLGVIPVAHQADLRAYEAAIRGMTFHYIEQFTVHDGHKVGGTPDRVLEWQGQHYIGDIKTGSIEWGGLKIAMQLAMYAHSVPYHPTSGRLPYAHTVDTQRALVIHLPAGEGQCYLHWVNIAAGWEAVHTAADVRKWRARRDWFTVADPEPPAPVPATGDSIVDVGRMAEHLVGSLIDNAISFEELREIWAGAVKDGTWTDEHVQLAKQRRAELERKAS
jgi:hypothetical protein